MKLLKYKDMLSSSKEKVDPTRTMFRAREVQKKAELNLCKLDNHISDLEEKIIDLSSSYPFDFEALIDAMDDLDLNNRRKEQMEQIINEMFGG